MSVSLPLGLSLALRPRAALPLLASVVAAAVMFAATPFLIPEVVARYRVPVGAAGLISLAQVGAFAAAAFALPRLATPSAGVYRTAAAVLVAANLVSSVAFAFPMLVLVRTAAGAGAGALTWMAWSDAMHSRRALVSISAAAPVATLVASPLIAAVSMLGDRAVYAMLAVAAAPLLLLRYEPAPGVIPIRSVSPSRSNRVLLAALLLLTFFGAALFIYLSVAAGIELGLSPVAASFGFSLNAAGGLMGARLSSAGHRPGWWLASTGPAAALAVVGGHPLLYFAGLWWWGFAFWVGVPGVMRMLADRSLHPSERAGDAQSAMAVGRALAPLLGGALAASGGYSALAIVSGCGLTIAGLGTAAVQEVRERSERGRARPAVSHGRA